MNASKDSCATRLRRKPITPLAHANSWLHRGLQIHLRPAHDGGDDNERPTEHTREARSWFASSKQALLARHGVGTIDQALLGVVAAKYCAVRLFGLAGKVVILDEVHSYDAYMSRLIDCLITRLLELKCMVLVLSATLTSARRAGLLQAAGAKSSHKESAYPLVTSVNTNGEATTANPNLPQIAPLNVQIRFLAPEDLGTWNTVLETAEGGGCVLVIRNTVEAAQDTFHLLQSLRREGGPEIALLHSRFPQFAREEKESEWMNRLGKDASRRPNGCVLVATQVVEQSVDIDADLLVTDLAPTDVLLQRMGRLWRHERGKRPVGHPVVRILSNTLEAMADPRQLRDTLGAFFGQGTIPARHTCRPTFALAFKPQRGVAWILLEKGKRFVRQILNILRQAVIVLPELRAGEMPHSSLQRPA